MDNSGSVIACNEYYNEGIELFKAGDIQGAREKLLKAAEIGAYIAKTTTNIAIHDQYRGYVAKILAFVKERCNEKKPIKNTNESSSGDKLDDENATLFKPVDTTNPKNKVTFDDVAGLKEVKDEIIYNVIKPLERPDVAKIYKVEAGAKILLYGPPGTGKTFIAKAIASELGCVFYSIKCSDLVSKYMGDSPKLVTKLFQEAQEHEKAAIFFDEFDSLVAKREGGDGSTDKERNSIVSAFLTNVDGFTDIGKCKMLLLIAATNIPWSIDSAILRGGRFSTKIYIGLPDLEARLFLVKKAFDGVPMEDNVDLNDIARRLDGYGGGDIGEICKRISNQAYRRAIEMGQISRVNNDDVDYILERSFPSTKPEDLEKFENYKSGK